MEVRLSDGSPASIFRLVFFLSLGVIATYLAVIITSIGLGGPGDANISTFSISGHGDLDAEHRYEYYTDRAAAKGADIDYKKLKIVGL